MKKVRQQPRIKGIIREPSSTALLPEINAELRRIGALYGVTPSWVRATILADALHIRKQPRYDLHIVPKKKRRAS